jgi:hypothetical protein
MDEEELDVIDNGEEVDLDSDTMMARRYSREEMRRRAKERMDEMQRRVTQAPYRVFSGAVGVLPVQTREHLRLSVREGVLAVQSFFDAVGSTGVTVVDRLFADPRTPQETAQPRRIAIEREDATSV